MIRRPRGVPVLSARAVVSAAAVALLLARVLPPGPLPASPLALVLAAVGIMGAAAAVVVRLVLADRRAGWRPPARADAAPCPFGCPPPRRSRG